MRNVIPLLVAALVASACASAKPADAPPPAAPAAVIQVHNVSDLVQSNAEVVALADEIRTALVREGTASEQKVSVTAHRSAVVVVADPASQATVKEKLQQLRFAKAP